MWEAADLILNALDIRHSHLLVQCGKDSKARDVHPVYVPFEVLGYECKSLIKSHILWSPYTAFNARLRATCKKLFSASFILT